MRDALALVDPGVGVGHQAERRVAEREFAGEDGLGVAGHADDRPALGGVPAGLRSGGEPRSADDDERSRGNRVPAGALSGLDGYRPARRAVRVGERYVDRAAFE